MARAAPATAGLAIAADAQFPVDFFVLGTQTSKWSGHAIAVEHWKGEHAEGCSYTTPHIVEYQMVNQFFGGKARNTARLGRAGNYRSNTRAS